MTRTNPEKLSVKYPVVKFIKRRMKLNDDIEIHQINKFDNRVKGSPFLLQIIEYTQELYDKVPKKETRTREEGRLADIVSSNYYTIENLKKQVADLQVENEDLKLQLDHYKCYD